MVRSRSASIPANPLIMDPNLPSVNCIPFSLNIFNPLNFFNAL